MVSKDELCIPKIKKVVQMTFVLKHTFQSSFTRSSRHNLTWFTKSVWKISSETVIDLVATVNSSVEGKIISENVLID